MITPELIRAVAPSNPDPASVAAALRPVLERYDIDDTPERLGMFLAQWAHESNFVCQTENLNYSAQRLCQVWRSRFPTLASAQPFARNPQALANRVYNGRMGNRMGSNDGWLYRGRGWPQLTGRSGYQATGRRIGVDLEGNPDLMLTPEVSAAACGDFWDSRGLNHLADRGDFREITYRINGGFNGLDDRVRRYEAVMPLLSEAAPRVILIDRAGQEVDWSGNPDKFGDAVLSPELISQLRIVYPSPGGPWSYPGLTIWIRRNGDMVLERAPK